MIVTARESERVTKREREESDVVCDKERKEEGKRRVKSCDCVAATVTVKAIVTVTIQLQRERERKRV